MADGASLDDRFGAVLGTPTGPGWCSVTELFGDGLGAAVDALAAVRGADGPAVAATLLVEQYALRVAYAVVAVHVRDGVVLASGRVRVQVVDGGIRQVAFGTPARPGTPVDVGVALRDGFEPVVAAVHRRTRAGRRTLRGSMANAVANAYLRLSWPCDDPAQLVPDARAVLYAAGWADLVGVRDVDGWMYTDRNTCCLAFRTSVNRARDQHYCLTCPIVPRETTLALFREATADYSERRRR